MSGKTVIVTAILLSAAMLAACAARTASPESGTESGSEAGEVSTANDTGGYVELVDALRAAGATVEPAGEIEQPFFSVTGQSIEVNGQMVQVFEYADEAARQAESDTISPDGSSIGTSMVTWVDQPHFWAKGRLIALYVGQDAATIQLLNEALGQTITSPAG